MNVICNQHVHCKKLSCIHRVPHEKYGITCECGQCRGYKNVLGVTHHIFAECEKHMADDDKQMKLEV